MKRPQVLAPAGSQEALEAAIAGGADAVYFGLDEGFNARARAANFPVAQLAQTVAKIHHYGVRAYLALNTLIFESELASVVAILEQAQASQVDAIIVQDPALAILAARYFPKLEIHASTQMTISSPQAAQFAKKIGCCQVVLPRELSVDEIEYFVAHCGRGLRTEVFIAGALCMAYSGQCLSSEAWGGRSANRGRCAQACRLPYQAVVDGQILPLENLEYLLSPADLAGFRAVEKLAQVGVHTFKIEGRQKDGEYVFRATKAVKGWIDATEVPSSPEQQQGLQEDLRNLALAYSRGLSSGFFEGVNHQTLVRGDLPRHLGLLLGTVQKVKGRRLLLQSHHQATFGEGSSQLSPLQQLQAPQTAPMPELGQGVVFRKVGMTQEQEIGGSVFGVEQVGPDKYWLDLGARGPKMTPWLEGAKAYLTSDPHVSKIQRQQIRRAMSQPPTRKSHSVFLTVTGQLGSPLKVKASLEPQTRSGAFEVSSSSNLEPAKTGGLGLELLHQKLSFPSDSGLALQSVDSQLDQQLFVPVSQLKEMRRALQEQITASLRSTASPIINSEPTQALDPRELLAQVRPIASTERPPGLPKMRVLVRTFEQLQAVIDAGLDEVTLDWMELVGLTKAVQQARQAGLRVGIATVRIQKPQEHGYDRRIAALKPDFVLVRHWGALMEFSQLQQHPPLIGDFSLNVTNSITAQLLFDLGLERLTASHDLDRQQLGQMLEFVDPARIEVVLHHHISTFHTEHCVYSHILSNGTDYRSCGRPCEAHQLGLQDRKGIIHPVVVDVGCRNTVFNGQAQSGARLWSQFQKWGVGTLRLEFVWEDQATTAAVLASYQGLWSGQRSVDRVLQEIGAVEQFGVTLGTMQVIAQAEAKSL